MDINLERTTSQNIIQIGSMDVPIGNGGKRPIVRNNKVVTRLREHLSLLMTMKLVEVVPTPSTSCQGSVLLD
jgi:hypothetical protein